MSRDGLVERLEKLLNERGVAAVMNDGETEGAVTLRMIRHNKTLAQFVGENWPTIIQALRTASSEDTEPSAPLSDGAVERVARAICFGGDFEAIDEKHHAEWWQDRLKDEDEFGDGEWGLPVLVCHGRDHYRKLARAALSASIPSTAQGEVVHKGSQNETS